MNRGFTAIECLLCVSVMAILMTMTAGRIKPITVQQETVSRVNEIVMDQYQAVVNCERVENDYTGFNRKGNVRQRDTIYINDVPVIISLGTGRIYVRE